MVNKAGAEGIVSGSVTENNVVKENVGSAGIDTAKANYVGTGT